MERTREVYERAVANIPLSSADKRYWRRYVYLWVKYALFEELQVGGARLLLNCYYCHSC